MNSQNNNTDSLASFIESVCEEDRFRVDEDLGQGFVKLKSSEAERRQAAQDIRSSEDIVIELLRNSRDAGARTIFVSTYREADIRTIVVIDDGCGLPPSMTARIFDARVTSKLDSAHMDLWGMHGRGMALYSIKVNALEARVAYSVEGQGTSVYVQSDAHALAEKKDQSTFPTFVIDDDRLALRGPKNIIRTVVEFALQHNDELNVMIGSPAEIASTLYTYGVSTVPALKRAFRSPDEPVGPCKLLGYASDAAELAAYAAEVGLVISERSARRIIDGKIPAAPLLMDRINASLAKDIAPSHAKPKHTRAHAFAPHISAPDLDAFSDDVKQAFSELAQKYYLEDDVEPLARVRDGKLLLSIDLHER